MRRAIGALVLAMTLVLLAAWALAPLPEWLVEGAPGRPSFAACLGPLCMEVR
jgi:hypothetical protein